MSRFNIFNYNMMNIFGHTRLNSCVKMTTNKYSLRNSPPYPANKCKTRKKKGNDGNCYVSKPDKNGTYKWVLIDKKNKTLKNKATKKDLQMLAKKYGVSQSGSSKQIAETLMKLRENLIKNKTDKKIIEQFL